MYNAKIRESIYKYMQKRKDDPLFKEQKIKWSRECFNRMKEENGDRYLKKKEGGRMRYWLKCINESENKENVLERLKNKDSVLFEKIINLKNFQT